MNKLEVINEDGEKVLVEIIVSFSIEEFNKNYIVYTLNDRGDSPTVTVLISEIVYQNDKPKIVVIPENEISFVLNFYDNIRDSIAGER